MATYREIKGLRVPYLDSDLPSASASTQEGSVWYYSATGKLRAFIASDTWATSLPLNTGRKQNTGAGTYDAALSIGGFNPIRANVEEYNGSGWAEIAHLNVASRLGAGGGTTTAALDCGGYPHPSAALTTNELFDGPSWTEAADLNTGRGYLASATLGTTTAALVMGGLINPELNPSPYGAVGEKAESEEWNGSAWTEGSDLNTGRAVATGAGTQTAALFISGGDTAVANVEAYDGSSWTEIADVNTAVKRLSSGGDQNDAIKASGNSSANVEQWDGTSWTEVANVSTTRGYAAFGFSSGASNGFIAGGTPPTTNVTEEWTQASAAVTFTSS